MIWGGGLCGSFGFALCANCGWRDEGSCGAILNFYNCGEDFLGGVRASRNANFLIERAANAFATACYETKCSGGSTERKFLQCGRSNV